MNTKSKYVYASAVCVDNKAALIIGKSGAGKTKLAIEVMALGGKLVGDDQVILTFDDGICVAPHDNAANRFEMRGVGIFSANVTSSAKLQVVVDLDQEPSGRLPNQDFYQIHDVQLPKINAKGLPHLASFLYLYLKGEIEAISI